MSQETEVRRKFEEWAKEQTLWVGFELSRRGERYDSRSLQAAWLAWQEQEKRKDLLCATLKIMNATCLIANEVLEEQLPKITAMQELIVEQRVRIAFLQKQADRLDGLRLLCGYVEDGTHATVAIGQDDATRDWFIDRDRKQLAYGDNFTSAIDKAIAKEPKDE